MSKPYTPPAPAPILDNLDKIQNELLRLKAIEQSVKDFVYDQEKYAKGLVTANKIYLSTLDNCASLSYQNLKELI